MRFSRVAGFAGAEFIRFMPFVDFMIGHKEINLVACPGSHSHRRGAIARYFPFTAYSVAKSFRLYENADYSIIIMA